MSGLTYIFFTSNFEIGVFNKISNLMESKRFGTIIHALNDVNSNPVFGVGLGQYSIDGVNIISWYALLAAETGIFTLLLLFFFFVSVIHRIVSNQNIPGAHVFLYSFLYGIFHLATTPTFFAPALWLLLIIYYSHLTQSKKIEFIRERFSHE